MVNYTDLQSMIDDGIVEEHIMRKSANCLDLMEPEFIEYVVGESVTLAYLVKDSYLNLRESMQGGLIAAAFDNAFGFLIYLVTKKIQVVGIDLCVSYHRPIFEKDKLIVTIYLKFKGKNIVHLIGEAYNEEKKLIATATSNLMLLENNKFFKNDI